jgi:hypothetical protein
MYRIRQPVLVALPAAVGLLAAYATATVHVVLT